MSQTLLKKITPGRETWNVKVRVARMWDSRNLKTNELISFDMILLDEEINTIKEVQVASGKAPVRKIELELQENKIVSVNLWGQLATEISDDYVESGTGPHVVIVTSATVKTYLGEYTLSTTNASKIYLNLDIEEVAELLTRYAHSEPCVKITQSQLATVSDEELAKQNRKTILDVLLMESELIKEEFKFTCIAEIKKVYTTSGWFYIGCDECKRKVLETNESTWCPYCKREPKFPMPRYRVQVQVADSTGTTNLVIFDAQAEKMIDKTAKELRLAGIENNDTEKIPHQIQKLCGKKYIFQVHVTTYNIEKRWDDFTVKKVWDPIITGEDQTTNDLQHQQAQATLKPEIESLYTFNQLKANKQMSEKIVHAKLVIKKEKEETKSHIVEQTSIPRIKRSIRTSSAKGKATSHRLSKLPLSDDVIFLSENHPEDNPQITNVDNLSDSTQEQEVAMINKPMKARKKNTQIKRANQIHDSDDDVSNNQTTTNNSSELSEIDRETMSSNRRQTTRNKKTQKRTPVTELSYSGEDSALSEKLNDELITKTKAIRDAENYKSDNLQDTGVPWYDNVPKPLSKRTQKTQTLRQRQKDVDMCNIPPEPQPKHNEEKKRKSRKTKATNVKKIDVADVASTH